VIGDKEGNPQNKLRDPPLLVHHKLILCTYLKDEIIILAWNLLLKFIVV
jgi:hypothetical protein